MKITLSNEDYYREQVKEYFDNIVYGRLLSIDPSSLDNENLLSRLTDYDKNEECPFNNFCTWLTVGEMDSDNRKNRDYSFICFYANDEFALSIKNSQFIYPMSIHYGSVFSAKYDSKNAKYRCLLNGNPVNPKVFADDYKGKRVFLSYFFDAVNSFDKINQCYFFYVDKSPDEIRRLILISQRFTLNSLLRSPERYAPGASLKIEGDYGVNYVHNVKYGSDYFNEISNVITEIFNRDYKAIVMSRLNDIRMKL